MIKGVKRKICGMLAFLMCLSCVACGNGQDENTNVGGEVQMEEHITHNETIEKKNLLDNTIYKLQVEKKLKVAYLGGSVTSGYGATDAEQFSWRVLTTNWLKEQYPNAEIASINAGLGGTGSEFGAYRVVSDLKLNDENACPDLVFLEFAINDLYDDCSESEVYMESMVNSIYQYAPYADIIMIFTTDFARSNTEYTHLVAHKEVAEAYQIPYISVGAQLWDAIVEENGGIAPATIEDTVWKKYFIDEVHPTNEGYQKYATSITAYLSELFAMKEETPSALRNAYCPEKSMSDVPVAPHIVNFSGQSFASDSITQKSDGSIFSHKAGTSFTVEFTGTELKLWVMGTPHGGSLSVTVDEEEYPNVDLYKRSINHMVVPVVENLSASKHEVTFTLQESLAGSDMDIRYLMISGSEFEGIQVK